MNYEDEVDFDVLEGFSDGGAFWGECQCGADIEGGFPDDDGDMICPACGANNHVCSRG